MISYSCNGVCTALGAQASSLCESCQSAMHVAPTFALGAAANILRVSAGPGRIHPPKRRSHLAPPAWILGTLGHKQMGGAHDAHWIRPGLPGAGHLMVFNNGQYLYQ